MSGIGSATIKRMQVMDGVPSGNVRTLLALKSALEGAGVEFVGTPSDSPGVLLIGQNRGALKPGK